MFSQHQSHSIDCPGRAFRNPFCTARIRPGAARYIHSGQTTTPQLVRSLIQHDCWGEIVGPHGSGKSTLVREMISHLESLRLKSRLVVLHHRPQPLDSLLGRNLPDLFPVDADPSDLLVIDGGEQLTRWQRWRLVRICRRNGRGLLVTSHRPWGLPSLFNTQVSGDLARQIVSHLLQTWPPCQSWSETRLERWLEHAERLATQKQGNLREVLFALYDQFLDEQ